MNEKMKILKMLEEGKITSEEAIKLLEAIGEREETFSFANLGGVISRIVGKELKRIPEIIEKSINAGITSGMSGMKYAWKTAEDFEAKDYTFQNIEKIKIENFTGSTEIMGEERDDIHLSAGGEVKEKDGILEIFNFVDSIDCRTPFNMDLNIKDMAGSTYINNISGNMEIANYAGDVEIQNSKGRVKIRAMAGDITIEDMEGEVSLEAFAGDVELKGVKRLKGEIESFAGDVVIEIPEGAELEIVAESIRGDVIYPQELSFVKKGRKYHIGKGENSLYVKAREGDIIIKEVRV